MADEMDEKTFAEYLRRAQAVGLTAVDFSNEFGISLTSARRWLKGKNYPHPAMRPLVVKWIEAVVQTEKKT